MGLDMLCVGCLFVKYLLEISHRQLDCRGKYLRWGFGLVGDSFNSFHSWIVLEVTLTHYKRQGRVEARENQESWETW